MVDVEVGVIHLIGIESRVGFHSDDVPPLVQRTSTKVAREVQHDPPFLRALRRQPSHLPGMPTRAELVARYFERSGRPAVDFTFYEVFGLFRVAVIAQQIYYRYHRKQTRNPAFRFFWLFVNYLAWRCRRILAERG